MKAFKLVDDDTSNDVFEIYDDFAEPSPFSIAFRVRDDDPIYFSPDEAVLMAENLLRRARKHREIAP